jgi:hypothetical protein
MALLPLDSFRKIIGYHPFHFWGLTNATVPVTSACNGLLKQYNWQGVDAPGRSEIAEAIETAEARLREYLGYSVAPRYATETLSFPRFGAGGEWRWGSADADGRWLSVQLSEGQVQALGVETLTLIDGTVAVVYTDEDGDGLDDTFTLSVATTVTEPTELAVYFNATDRLDNEEAGDRWRIQPVQVAISGGTATITGRAWLLVKPIKYEGVTAPALDPDTASNFATTLAVYRRTTNPNGTTVTTSQGTLIWETAPWPSWALCCGAAPGSADSSSDPAAVAQAVARVGLRDAAQGIVSPAQATYDSTTGTWGAVAWGTCRAPDRVTVRYLAGLPLERQQMAVSWQTIVARLAAAELPVRLCDNNTGSHVLHRWQFDRARSAGVNDEQYSIAPDDLDNPFGTREGHLYAWRQVKNLRRLRGFLPG